jgi:hypothetical protein
MALLVLGAPAVLEECSTLAYWQASEGWDILLGPAAYALRVLDTFHTFLTNLTPKELDVAGPWVPLSRLVGGYATYTRRATDADAVDAIRTLADGTQ